ncbi:putative cholinephosphotransferase 1 [Apostichopus japonicus]|uniref:diacylglycerol cholinephosphotransferase n=1 Tax=Stichopus japonicus TaxID=307972 RepID=A0A2G8KL49_STIJA|nr:putative cholinephosphotransferase 1 [Apostichopus japonicus]
MSTQEAYRPLSKMMSDVFASVDLLTTSQLKRLEEHKYSASGKSITEPFLQIFWSWLVEQIPRSIAPNLITIVGLAFNFLGMVILISYCPNATEEAPRWAYVFAAFTLLVYQSLDAIDGKQARRTNSASPLGELFDHGCDSCLSVSLVSLSVVVSLQLGDMPGYLFVFCFCSFFMFYAAHWQTYVSGTLKFGVIDVTEGQLLYCFVMLISGAVGPQIWSSMLLGLQLKLWSIYFGLAVALFTLYQHLQVILKGGIGRAGSTVANTSVIAPIFHIGSVILLAFLIAWRSKMEVYQRNPNIYILAFGMLSAKSPISSFTDAVPTDANIKCVVIIKLRPSSLNMYYVHGHVLPRFTGCPYDEKFHGSVGRGIFRTRLPSS